MKNSKFVEWRQATAEDILEIIRADYLDRVNIDSEVEEGEKLSFDTTIEEWRQICDLLPWRHLVPHLNAWFDVNFKMSEWKLILKPEETKTLRDLCQFVAQRAMLPSVKVRRILGKECLEGSTFMAIKHILQEAGVPVSRVRPSTNLAPFTELYWKAFLGKLRLLAPNALPAPTMQMNLGHRFAMILFAIGGIGLIASFFKSMLGLSVVAIVLGMLVSWISSYFPPRRVAFGNLMTFRDLTYAFVNEIKRDI